MAWPDGSRFLIAHGVKWGSGPKMYKGSKNDTVWNNDLLWKLYVEQEARKTGIHLPKGPDDIEAMPPLMRPLACAINKDVPNVTMVDPFRDDGAKTCQSARGSHWPHNGPAPQIRQAAPHMGLTARRVVRERERLAAHKKLAAQMSALNGRSVPSARGRGSARGSARGLAAAGGRARSAQGHRRDNGSIIAHDHTRSQANLPPVSSGGRRAGGGASGSGATNQRLARLEQMLASMQRDRSQLASSLRAEVQRRQRVEQELRGVKEQMGRSLRQQSAQQQKLHAYQEVMKPLARAISRRQSRN